MPYYLDVEAGGGFASNYYGVTPSFGVNSSGFGGGAAVGFRVPINATPDSLIFPDGARIGILGSSFNGSQFYMPTGFTYGVKSPLAFYGEAEFANPTINSLVNMIVPNTPIRVYSSVGLAGIWEKYSWTMTMPGWNGSTNTLQFAPTTSIRAEWSVTPTIDMYLQWRTFYMTPTQVGVPGPVVIYGFSNFFSVGAQF
jgi:hypothetical protein